MAEVPEEELNDLLLDQDEEIPTDFLECLKRYLEGGQHKYGIQGN